MIDVYIYGCSTCGTNALLLNRLKRARGNVNVYNSVQIDNRNRHIAFLEHAGIETRDFPAIIVVNGGERIIRLSQWTLL